MCFGLVHLIAVKTTGTCMAHVPELVVSDNERLPAVRGMRGLTSAYP